MPFKIAILIGALMAIATTDIAQAQRFPENSPLIETRRETFIKASRREHSILRPWVSTGESRDTPNENQNYYLAPGS